MELRHLRYFLAVAREGSMTRAAQRLHVTQPTLSKAVRALEDELCQQLYVRHGLGIELTEAGVLLRKRAEDFVQMADKIEAEFATLGDVSGGDLYLGLAESYQIRYLAREIAALKRAYPDLHYHITSGDTEQVTERLDNGLLDFAILAEEPDLEKYEALPFPEPDVWGLIMPADCPLAAQDELCMDDLVGLPLFCSEQGWRGEIARWAGARRGELRLEGSFRLSYNGAIFTREGLGYLLTLDRLVDTSEQSGLTFRPLAPRVETRLHVIWRRDAVLSPIAARFLDQLRGSFSGTTVEDNSSPVTKPDFRE